MSELLRVAIVDATDETREFLTREINACSDLAWLEADCQRYDVFVDVVAQHSPDVAIVNVDGDEALSLPLIQQLGTMFPALAVIAVSSNTDARFAADLIRLGVRDFVPYPPREGELGDVMRRIAPTVSTSPRSLAPMLAMRRIICVAGSDGGVGCTTIAVNLGCALAQDPSHNVALVDLDAFLGDAHILLDMSPRTSLAQLCDNIEQLDNAYLKRAATKHDCGLHLIPHPDKLSELESLTPERIARFLQILKRSYTHVVVDLSKAYSPLDLAALAAADDILLVLQTDMSSLYNAMRLHESLEEHGIGDRVKRVVNRCGSEGNISLEKAAETLGKPIDFQVPNDTRNVAFARDNGQPLHMHARNGRSFQAILSMANTLLGRDRKTVAPSAGSGSLFGRLFQKAKK
jgi:pilus assembly protein CpaE